MLEYLAGFFDGEGCVSTEKRSGGGRTRHVSVQVVQIVNFRHILEEYQRRWGGQIYSKGTHPKRRRCLTWHTSGNGARKMLTALLPYLRVKRKQARLALHLLKLHARNVKRRPVSDKEQALRLKIAGRISVLNHLVV